MFKPEHLIRRRATIGDMDSVKVRRKELRAKDKDPELLVHCESLWMNLSEFREQRKRGNRFYDGDQWGDLITVNGKTMTYRQLPSQARTAVMDSRAIRLPVLGPALFTPIQRECLPGSKR